MKINNRNTISISEIYLKLTITRAKGVNGVFGFNFLVTFTYSVAFIVNYEQI